MNCSLCRKKMDSYISGSLHGDVKKDVRTHLDGCRECSKLYAALHITNQVINQEKEIKSNPFLATRVMTQIESKEEITSTVGGLALTRILQPVFLTASIVLALFIGIYAGNSYQTKTTAQNMVPEELLLLNDASMESLNLILSEE